MAKLTLPKIKWQYAIVEILIVFIGISVVFGLNQWAESNKDQKARITYIKKLVSDLDDEIEYLESNIDQLQTKSATIQSHRPYFYGKTAGQDTMVNKFWSILQIVPYQPNDNTYTTLINSGDLGLIGNLELRKNLQNHYSNQELIKMDYERQNKIHENYFGDYMIYKMDFTKKGRGDASFLQDQLLGNIVQSLFGSYNFAITSSEKGIQNCKDLKALLQEKS